MKLFYPNRPSPGLFRRCLALTVLFFGLLSAVSAQGTCATAIPLTPGTAQSGNTATGGDTYDDNICLGSYDGGDDYLFVYTATAADDGMAMNLTLTSPGTWTGISLQSACPDVAVLADCLGASTSSTGNKTLNGVGPLVAGTTYYIHISTFPAPQSVTFTLAAQIVAPPAPPATVGTLATDGCNDMVSLSTTLSANTVNWVEFNYDGNSQSLTFDTEGSALTGGTNDTEIGVYGALGNLLGNDDDGGTGSLSSLTLTGLAAGTYYIVAGGFNTNFNPAFDANSPSSGRTGTLVFNVTASRPVNPLVCNDASVDLDGTGNATIAAALVTTGTTTSAGDMLTLDVSAFSCNTVGPQAVTVTYVEASNNCEQTCQVTVTVNDATPATIDCSNLVGVQAFTSDPTTCFFVVAGTELDPAGFDDNCGNATLTNDFNNTATLAGAELPVGTTMVTFTASDVFNAPATCTVEIEVASGSPACDPPPSACGEFGYTIQFFSEELFQVDLATGALTSIATLSPSPGNIGSPLITGGTIIENELYFTDGGEQDFVYSVNIGTGVVTEQAPIAGVVAGEIVIDLEVDPTTGTLYGLSADCGSNSTLYEVDLDSATPFTAIGSITGATCAASLVINMLGEAFALTLLPMRSFP